MRTPSSGGGVSGKSGPAGLSPGQGELLCRKRISAVRAPQSAARGEAAAAAAARLGGDSGTGQSSGWSWQRMVGDSLPSATAKILLPSDVANQFTGVVHFVLSHNKPLIPGLETDLDSVGAACGSVGQGGPPAAGRGSGLP